MTCCMTKSITFEKTNVMIEEKRNNRVYLYGEKTVLVSVHVPASKKDEIRNKFYDILREYENPSMLVMESSAESKEIESIDKKHESPTDMPLGIEVSALPKDKKQISVGLYSGVGKFYTNKVVSGQLKILEWESIAAAKFYLDNLKK